MGNINKPHPKSGLEIDVIYARRMYCYLVNHPAIVKFVKRKMNKRFRSESKKLINR